MTATIKLDIQQRYENQQQAFRLKVHCKLPANGITGIFGASGSGKTTLLRCIAGLEHSQSDICVNDITWQNSSFFLATHQRPLAYVFQDSLLFPHMNVLENLQFSIKRADKPSTETQLNDLLEIFNIGHLLNKKTQQLSGGEKQRVAIVRALLIQPQLLLMDEPLAALDDGHKQQILTYLERLKANLGIPILYVSHNMDEIARLADHLLVLENGHVIHNDELANVLNDLQSPLNHYPNSGSLIQATIKEKDPHWQLVKVNFDGGYLWLEDKNLPLNEQVRLRILARDISLTLDKPSNSSILNILSAEVVALEMNPHQTLALVKLCIGETQLIAKITRRSINDLDLVVGSQVWAQIKSAALIR